METVRPVVTCDSSCTGSTPRGGWRSLFILMMDVGGIQRHGLALTASEVLQKPPPAILWVSRLGHLHVDVVALLSGLWSHACCDTDLSDVARNPTKLLELRGQGCTAGAAGFIFCVNATVELWFLWNAACVGWAKTPREVLSSVFKATSDRLASRRLNNQNFYSPGSKSLVLSSCFTLCWQCKRAINLA